MCVTRRRLRGQAAGELQQGPGGVGAAAQSVAGCAAAGDGGATAQVRGAGD